MRIKIKIKKWKVFPFTRRFSEPTRENSQWELKNWWRKIFFLYAKKASLESFPYSALSERSLWKMLKNHMLAHGNCLTSSIHGFFSYVVLKFTRHSDDAVKIFPPHSCKQRLSFFSLSAEMNDVVQPLTNSSYAVIPHICVECY